MSARVFAAAARARAPKCMSHTQSQTQAHTGTVNLPPSLPQRPPPRRTFFRKFPIDRVGAAALRLPCGLASGCTFLRRCIYRYIPLYLLNHTHTQALNTHDTGKSTSPRTHVYARRKTPNMNNISRDFSLLAYCILSAAYLSRVYRFYAVYTFRFRVCLLCFAFYALEDGVCDVIKSLRPQTQFNFWPLRLRLVLLVLLSSLRS